MRQLSHIPTKQVTEPKLTTNSTYSIAKDLALHFSSLILAFLGLIPVPRPHGLPRAAPRCLRLKFLVSISGSHLQPALAACTNTNTNTSTYRRTDTDESWSSPRLDRTCAWSTFRSYRVRLFFVVFFVVVSKALTCAITRWL